MALAEGGMSGRYVLVASGNQYLFNLKAGNSEQVLTSERYSTRQSALGGIAAVRKSALNNERYELRVAASGERYFVLHDANDQAIATSQMYSSALARDHGMIVVKTSAPGAPIEDQS
jgi:uncharacterized protein